MQIRETINNLLAEVATMTACQLTTPMSDDIVLLESGLDSLGFAILVARLEEELSLDPFSDMVDAVYPRTFGEFVAIYEAAIK
ncbi:MAG: phosphopantetheine-binding protein [Psychrobium sp.]